MANVSAGSILNQRVFTRQNRNTTGSGGNGAGVRRNVLAQSRVVIGANRTRISGRASYTQLSNQINGRKEIVYVNNKSCGSCSGEMNTMEKIAMYNAIAQQGIALAASIKELFSSTKTDSPKDANTKDPNIKDAISTLNGSMGKLINSDGSTVNSLAMTIDMGALTDIDYDAKVDTLFKEMKKADNSQELYNAIQNAKIYEGQMRALFNNKETVLGDFKAKCSEGEVNLENAKDFLAEKESAVGTAEADVKGKEQAVQSQRTQYEVAQNAFAKNNEDYKNLLAEEKQATAKYGEAKKGLVTAENNQRIAQSAFDDASRALTTAENNFASAKANYDAIKAQPESEAKTAQLKLAEEQLRLAEKAKDDAVKQKGNALENLKSANDAQKFAKENLDIAHNDVKSLRQKISAKAKELAGSDVNLKENLNILQSRERGLNNAEDVLEGLQESLETARDEKTQAEDMVQHLEIAKQEYEAKVNDFKEIEEAIKKLDDNGDIKKYEQKLSDMLIKDKTKKAELEKKYGKDHKKVKKFEDKKTALDNISNDQKAGSDDKRAWAPSGYEAVTGKGEAFFGKEMFETPSLGPSVNSITTKSAPELAVRLSSLKDGDKIKINGHEYSVNGNELYFDGKSLGSLGAPAAKGVLGNVDANSATSAVLTLDTHDRKGILAAVTALRSGDSASINGSVISWVDGTTYTIDNESVSFGELLNRLTKSEDYSYLIDTEK